MNSNNLTLQTKPKHYRKTFATYTLKIINSRIQYYRRILNNNENSVRDLTKHEKSNNKKQIIQQKYDRDMKVRKLLNRAIKHLYE